MLGAALTMVVATSAVAQTDGAETAQEEITEDANGGDTGLWGLAGLLGLAGLAGRRRHDRNRAGRTNP